MRLSNIAVCVFLLCSVAPTATAQNQTVEYGDADELKDVTKLFVDTGTDMVIRDEIVSEIRKKLRDLKFVSKPEDSEFHLRFFYEVKTGHGGANPQGVILKTPVGTVVKILSKDRVRVLMSFPGQRRGYGIRIGWGKRRPEIEFAREFVKAYLKANSKKQEQPTRQLTSR